MKQLKKVFTLLLAVTMVCCLALPVFAETFYDLGTMTVTVDKTTVAPGESFTVTLKYTGIPPIKSIGFGLRFSSDVFTVVSTKPTVTPEAPLAGYDAREGYKFASAAWAEEVDFESFAFTFKVNDDAALGDYEIGLGTESVAKHTKDGGLAWKPTEIVPVTVKVAEASSTINGASLALGTSLTMNYYATVHEQHAGAQMRFTVNATEYVVDGVASGDEMVYALPLNPQQMADNIRAELILGDTVLASNVGYSVVANLTNVAQKDGASDTLKTLIANTLEYGAMAQIYMGYRTDRLANAGLADLGLTPTTDIPTQEQEEANGLYFDPDKTVATVGTVISGSVEFTNVNRLRIKFQSENMDAIVDSSNRYTALTIDGVAVDPANVVPVDGEENTYYIYSEAIYAVDLANYNEIIFKYGTTARNQKTLTMYYGVPSYVYRTCTGSTASEAMKDLARATYNYGVAAAAYAG